MTLINKKTIDWKVLLMGIGIPVFFCILIQFSYTLEKINAIFGVIFNLETFTAMFLIFFASILVAMVLKTKIKLGIVYGSLLGIISGLIIITIITILTLLTNPEVQLKLILNWNYVVYLIVSSLFQILSGAFGGILGSMIIRKQEEIF